MKYGLDFYGAVVWCGVGVVWSVHCPSVEKECQKTESQKEKENET